MKKYVIGLIFVHFSCFSMTRFLKQSGRCFYPKKRTFSSDKKPASFTLYDAKKEALKLCLSGDDTCNQAWNKAITNATSYAHVHLIVRRHQAVRNKGFEELCRQLEKASKKF